MSIWDTRITDAVLDDEQKADEVVFIGQTEVKEQVEPFIEADRFPHVLLTGDAGLGKTHFARWLAYKRQKPFYERLAPVKAQNLPPYGVLLLDEVHRQKDVEDLFPVMEKGLLSVIAATTKPQKLDSAFTSRFLLNLRLRRYSDAEIVEIMKHMLGSPEPSPELEVLAGAASGHPRTAERIVFTAMGLDTLNPETVLRACRITADGLTQDHMDTMKVLKALKKPAGAEYLSFALDLTDDRIRRVEHDLMERGLLELTSTGRKLTNRGSQYAELLEQEGAI